MAFLFPGQGAQIQGMLQHLPRDPAVHRTLRAARGVLGRRFSALDSATSLRSTEAIQPALLIAGVAAARALRRRGVEPAFVAGHSVGGFAAAVHADVLSFAAALRLVQLRARAMARASPPGSGMAALAGLSEGECQALIARLRDEGRALYLANRNSSDQFTVAGDEVALAALSGALQSNGRGRLTPLDVPVPSHTPLMAGVAQRMRAAASALRPRPPNAVYVGNRAARPLSDGHAIVEDLALGVAEPVRWLETQLVLWEAGARVFVEMSPGSVLTGIGRATLPGGRWLSVATEGLESVVAACRSAG